jgi:site-specific DNA recombinase
VVGEHERAFYGSQYALTAPLLEHYRMQLWLPEVGGPVRFHVGGVCHLWVLATGN